MSIKTFLQSELKKNNEMIKAFLDEVPQTHFFKKSSYFNANIAWQIGHLCLANYGQFVSFTGRNAKFPVGEEYQLLQKHCIGLGAVDRFLNESDFSRTSLMTLYDSTFKICHATIDDIPENEYNNPLPKVPFPHAFANTTLEVMGYALRHEMWHCAEIEALKREFQLHHVFLP